MNVQKHSENTLDGSSSDNSSPPPPRSTLKESSQSQTKNHGKAPTSSAPTLLKSHLPVDTDRPLTEVISEPFMPFDHQAAVVDPFTREMARDANFEQELGTMLLDLILETHAWSSARPKYESQMAIQKLEQKVTDVVEIEKEQEKTRSNLNEFVTRMRTALAALTGL